MVGVWSGIDNGVRSIRENRRDEAERGWLIECTLGI